MRETMETTYSPIKEHKTFMKTVKQRIQKAVLCSHSNRAHKVKSLNLPPITPPPYSALDPQLQRTPRAGKDGGVKMRPLSFASSQDFYDSLRYRERQRVYSYTVQESYSAHSRTIPTDYSRSAPSRLQRTRPYSCSDIYDKSVKFLEDFDENDDGSYTQYSPKDLPNTPSCDESEFSNDEELLYRPPSYLSPQIRDKQIEIPDHYESLKRRERRMKSSLSDENLSSPDYRTSTSSDENNNNTTKCFALHGYESPGEIHSHRGSSMFKAFHFDNVSSGHTSYDDEIDTIHRVHTHDIILEETSSEMDSPFGLLEVDYYSDRSTLLYETSDTDNDVISLPGLESLASSRQSLISHKPIITEQPIEAITISDPECCPIYLSDQEEEGDQINSEIDTEVESAFMVSSAVESQSEDKVEEIKCVQHIENTYFIPIVSPPSLVHTNAVKHERFTNTIHFFPQTVERGSIENQKQQKPSGEDRSSNVKKLRDLLSCDDPSEVEQNQLDLWDEFNELHDGEQEEYVSDWMDSDKSRPIKLSSRFTKTPCYDNKFQFTLIDFQSVFCGMKVVSDKNVLLKSNKKESEPIVLCDAPPPVCQKERSVLHHVLFLKEQEMYGNNVVYKTSKMERQIEDWYYKTFCIYDVAMSRKRVCSAIHFELINGKLLPRYKGVLSLAENVVNIEVKYDY